MVPAGMGCSSVDIRCRWAPQAAGSSSLFCSSCCDSVVWGCSSIRMNYSPITGTVVPGQNRGRSLGFPTINIDTIDPLPPSGIYAGWVELDGEQIAAAIHIGPVPAFGEDAVSVEAHLLDFTGDVYGKFVTLTCVKKIREVENFDDLALLQQQIERDVELVRTVLNASS